ncbi:MAG: type II toxin-antitoxin system RelE/ParE family toxin [Candidatus Korobacteraceae bacterium]
MLVEWLSLALADLDAEAAYIARDNPTAAEHVVDDTFAAADRLAAYPASGRPGRVLGTRELVVPGTPYILPYRIRGQTVEVIRVLHGSRKWPKDFK